MENVSYEVRGQTAWITIDRPEKLNALDGATMRELGVAVESARSDVDVRVVVITGSGDKAFVAGADIAEMSKMDAAEAQSFSRFLQRTLEGIETCPKPVIAAVNGFALGGGCELAMACHVRIASERAKFGQPEVQLGLIPGAGGTQRLPRIVGRGRALELIVSGEMIPAEEAHRIGLVNRVVPAGDLVSAVTAFAEGVAKKSPAAIGRAIEAVIAGSEMSQGEAMRLEAAAFGLCFATEDMKEGTRAFLEKRHPAFKGK